MTVAEYMQRFDELKTRSQIVEDPRHTLARFKSGLRFDIRKELLRQPLSSVEHGFQVALDMEEYLRVPTVKKITYQAGEIAAKRLTDGNRTARTTPLQQSPAYKWNKKNSFKKKEQKMRKMKRIQSSMQTTWWILT
jgi:hypothetical protein